MSDTLLDTGSVQVDSFAGGHGSPAGRRGPGLCFRIAEEAGAVELTLGEAVQVAHVIQARVQAYQLDKLVQLLAEVRKGLTRG